MAKNSLDKKQLAIVIGVVVVVGLLAGVIGANIGWNITANSVKVWSGTVRNDNSDMIKFAKGQKIWGANDGSLNFGKATNPDSTNTETLMTIDRYKNIIAPDSRLIITDSRFNLSINGGPYSNETYTAKGIILSNDNILLRDDSYYFPLKVNINANEISMSESNVRSELRSSYLSLGYGGNKPIFLGQGLLVLPNQNKSSCSPGSILFNGDFWGCINNRSWQKLNN